MANLTVESFQVLMTGITLSDELAFGEAISKYELSIRTGRETLGRYENMSYVLSLADYLSPVLSEISLTLGKIRKSEFSGGTISLLEKQFIMRNAGMTTISEMDNYVTLSGIVEELDFFIRETSVRQREALQVLEDDIDREYEKALQLINITVTLYLVGIAMTIFRTAYNKTVRARVAEEAATERSEALEDLVHARTADLEIQNQQLKEAGEMLFEKEKMTALGQVVAGVAHEVNTPLGICVTATSFLQDRIADTENPIARDEAEEVINLILDNVIRASNLVKGFKKVAVDEMDDECRPFDISSYLRDDLLPGLLAIIKTDSHKIVYQGPKNCVIYGYPGSMAQVVTNLVMNASIHGYRKINSGTINIDLIENADTIGIIVSDSGTGMTKNVQARIFDPFFTTNRENGGSGLGMMVIYNIVVVKLNGRVDCQTAPGEGSKFTITIPKDSRSANLLPA